MSTVTISNIDPTALCRVCFTNINLLRVIYPGTEDEQAHKHLLELVKTYLHLEFGGAKDFPCAVCEVCYQLLRDFDELYKNAQQHNDALKALIESKTYLESSSRPTQTTVEMMNAGEFTIVEVIEPSSVTEDESNIDKNIPLIEPVPEDDLFDGEIILQDVPYTTDTSNEERQVHVFHLDGELQQVIIAGESNGTNVSSLNGALQSKAAKKPTDAPNGRSTFDLNPLQRLSQKPSMQSINTHKSEHNNARQKPPRTAAVVGRREKEITVTKKFFRCKHCPMLFMDQSKYHSHKCIEQHPSTSQMVKVAPFTCKECNVNFRRELYWQKHLYEAHGICSENFGITCNICEIQFSQRQDYQLHVLAMHQDYSY